MALKTLIFGVDDLFNELKPYYEREVQRGNLEIVATIDDTSNLLVGKQDISGCDLAIISSRKNFYGRMKQLESIGFLTNKIIDGRIFKMPNLDFPRLIKEGVAYGTLGKSLVSWNDCLPLNHSRIYDIRYGYHHVTLSLGQKSYICGADAEGNGAVSIGKFCGIASDIKFRVGLNNGHNYNRVASYEVAEFEWAIPAEFRTPQGQCRIDIGNDVWMGRGCRLNCTNQNKPLVIGDGAVIASDSVVVKNVPPYAIVGGNPAKIIKFRFSEDVIESLLRIKWWDWSLDKIHDNFKYFNDIDKFISLHDR